MLGVIPINFYVLYFYKYFIYLLSYRNNTHFFAGNQKNIRINPNLQYYIIVPCFNEKDVIYHTLQKLLKFNQFQVVVVDNNSTDRSIEEIKKISNPRCHLVQRFAPNAHTGKGNALSYGLDFIREKITQEQLDLSNVIIGVVDADSQLADNTLEKLNIHFSISSTQASQFFRLKPIVQKLGPHPWRNALLDDYELTIKMMLKGIKIDYMPNTYVYQEALPSIKLLIRQRSRWAQGGQTVLSI
jgi:Glycosyltransferases, probably involved in cell wall biogenesis